MRNIYRAPMKLAPYFRNLDIIDKILAFSQRIKLLIHLKKNSNTINYKK